MPAEVAHDPAFFVNLEKELEEKAKEMMASSDQKSNITESLKEEKLPSSDTVSKFSVHNLDFAMENAWMRSFKRMRRAVAASEDNDALEEPEPAKEDAEIKDREWEIAKLQEQIRLAQK